MRKFFEKLFKHQSAHKLQTEGGANDEIDGIDFDSAHPRAAELVKNKNSFFWDSSNELAPFGSDEGDQAFSDFREWRAEHPNDSLLECLSWVIEEVGEIEANRYNEEILLKDVIKSQIYNSDYDDRHYIYTLDASLIATGFGQFVCEGGIDIEAKPVIGLALKRQLIWAELNHEWEHHRGYMRNIRALIEILEEA